MPEITSTAMPTGPICPVCGRIAQMTWIDERERRHYLHRQDTTAVLPLECVGYPELPPTPA